MTTRVEDGKLPRFSNQIVLPDDTSGIDVTSGAANTYGAWVVFSADIGSLDQYLNELLSMLSGQNNIVEFEIGIGGGGSEVTIAQGHIRLLSGIKEQGKLSLNNVRVPANSRLAIKVRDNQGTNFVYKTFLTLNS